MLAASKKNEQLNLILQTICSTGIRVSELRYYTVEAVRHGEITVNCKIKTRTILVPGKLKNLLLNFAKQEKIANLQNQLSPQCLSFDRVPQSEAGLRRLVNSLIDYPHCAVSMQLIPTKLTPAETDVLGRTRQMRDTLTRGVMDQSIGNVSFSLAEKHAETYKFYEENKGSALFQFNLVVYGSGQDSDSLASSCMDSLIPYQTIK